MNPLASTTLGSGAQASPFVGADICREARLALPPGAGRPVFEDEEWDFTEVIGLPVQMPPSKRRFDFTAIRDQRWRLVAKELIVAMLAPRHEAVALLPRAYRTPVHLGTAKGRLDELTRLLNWLPQQGIRSLGEVDEDCCTAWLQHRRNARDKAGIVIGDRSPATRRAAAQVVIDLLNYRELLTADRPRQGLRPWGGASASAVAEMRSGREENKTPPVPSHVLQPLLAAALYAVTTLGPGVAELAAELRQTVTMRSRAPERPGERAPQKDPLTHLTPVLARHCQDREPAARASRRSWSASGCRTAGIPATPCSRSTWTAWPGKRDSGISAPSWLPRLRPQLEEALATAGATGPFGRSARIVPAAGGEPMPWTVPLHRDEAERPGRRRPHRSDHRHPGGLRHAVQRGDGTAGGLAAAPAGKRAWHGPLPDRQQRRQGTAAGRHPGRVGRHRARPPGHRTRRATPRRPPRRGAAVRQVRLRRPLPVVPRLGQRPGRATARPRPHPRRPGDAEDAQANTGDRARLPARRPARSKTSPKAHFSRNNRRLRIPPRRRPGQSS